MGSWKRCDLRLCRTFRCPPSCPGGARTGCFWPRRPPRPESERYISDKTKTSRCFYIVCLLDESVMPSSTSLAAGVGNNRYSVDESGTSDRFDGDPHGRRDAPAPSVPISAAAAARATPGCVTNSRSGESLRRGVLSKFAARIPPWSRGADTPAGPRPGSVPTPPAGSPTSRDRSCSLST